MSTQPEGNLHSAPSLPNFDLIEYLQLDTRPAFIIDSSTDSFDVNASRPQVVFTNTALQRDELLVGVAKTLIDGHNLNHESSIESETLEFLSWLSVSPSQECISFKGFTWSSTCMQRRWIVVSGCRQGYIQRPAGTLDESLRRPGDSLANGIPNSSTAPGQNDLPLHQHRSQATHQPTSTHCTRANDLAQLLGVKISSHNLMVLGFDWSTTPLGDIEDWSAMLRELVPYMLNGLQPGVMTWGPERTLLYNEGYVSLIKALHPAALGSPANTVFGNFWDHQMEPKWRAVERYGAARHENTQIYMDRSGFLEETFFTYSLTPLRDAEGYCRGVDNRCFETTRQLVAERRMLSLLKISESTASVMSLDGFWQSLAEAMADNRLDLPLFALYSLQDSELAASAIGVESDTPVAGERWVLRGSTGYRDSHCAIPGVLEADSHDGFAPAFREAQRCSGTMLSSEGDSVLRLDLLQDCDTPELKLKCHQIVFCPLHSSSRSIVGFLALGINPSRPYDDEYKTFVRLLSRQIETSIQPILSLVNEKMQAQIIAQKTEYEQQLLSMQLEEQTLEARQSELRFLKFAKQTPLGVYIIDSDGVVKFANDAWYKLAGLDPNYGGTHLWRLNVHPDDKERVDGEWQRLTEGGVQENFEWRALRKVSGREDEIIYLRSSCFPELGPDGTMKSVTGVLVDLSLERAQQRTQNDRLQDALEAKRAQEYFMDMVSHELRNPLHSSLQLAEETATLIQGLTLGGSLQEEGAAANLRACIENIHTIMYCGHHQKQILDDVLTLSKLNSDMLAMSLNEVAPTQVVSKALKFFDSDIRLSDIEVHLNLSGIAAGTPNVLMDSGRVLQILFNLIGNSIKFMKDRSTRKLTVSVKMATKKPLSDQLRYLPSGKTYPDPTAEKQSKTSQVVYVHYSVEDTGPGLSPEEKTLLFERFKQASPRTHTQYGGSGLGLFISRELAERHGGEIGLTSVVDRGSIFAFYVKCLVVDQKGGTLPDTHISVASGDNGMVMLPRSTTLYEPKRPQPQSLPSYGNGSTILIVEDNIVNQKILNRQLKKLGYKTKTANHGGEALTIMQQSTWWHETSTDSFDLAIVLCDLEMPIMDGITCVRKIRQWQQQKLLSAMIPIVALTGNARTEQINAAKEAGFDEVVSKPYSVQDLVVTIEGMTLK